MALLNTSRTCEQSTSRPRRVALLARRAYTSTTSIQRWGPHLTVTPQPDLVSLTDANARLEQHVAERTAALAESEARLRRVQRIGRVGGFEIDLTTGINHRSGEYMAIQGRPAEPTTEGHLDWLARLHPDDRAHAEATFFACVRDPACTTYAQDYRIRTPDGSIRHIAARAEIERDPAGRPRRMVGAHVDVTELKQAEADLAASKQRLELAVAAAGMWTWELDVVTGRGHRAGCIPSDLQAFVLADYDIEDWYARMHPIDRETTREHIEALRDGRTPLFDTEFRVARDAPGAGHAWIASRGAVVERDSQGRTLRMAGVARDVSAGHAAKDRERLLMHEVDHRAKNALAIVLSMLRLTDDRDPAAFRKAVEARVMALARAQTTLADRNWSSVDLHDLLAGELRPFTAAARLDGPPVALPPAAVQPLAMTFHELATNAARHGALSHPAGALHVVWRLAGSPDRAALDLEWREHGGPAAPEPTHQGFGSRVIDGTVRSQLGGTLQRQWTPDGLVARMSVPLPAQMTPQATPDDTP